MLRVSNFGAELRRNTFQMKFYLVRCLATPVSGTSYLHCPGKDSLVFKTVGNVLDEAAEKFGDRPALISSHQNKRISFIQAKEKAEKLASGLLELGLNKGERVGLWGPNSAEWYIANLALAKCGAISAYINPAYQGSEIEHCLNKIGARMLISSDTFKTQNYYKILEGLCPELSSCQPGKIRSNTLPKLETLIFMSEHEKPGSYRYKDVLEMGTDMSKQKLKEITKVIEPEEPTNIQFTSGTTGKPKAAILSHFAIVNNSLFISLGQELHLKEHRVCLMGPFFHAMGSVIAILACLHHGTTLVIPDYIFNAEKCLASINDEKCTVVLGTPTMYDDVFRMMTEKNVALPTLELAMAGGSLCSPKLYKEMMSKLGIKRAAWLYGLTESGPVAFMTTPTDGYDRVTTSVGLLMPNSEAKVVDAKGAILPRNVAGELLLRGYMLMNGYWGDEEKTKESIVANNWLRTGDQFIIDETGYGKIVGRIKDLIIRGGENISPLEVEEFLLTHPDAAEVQVFGIPDERLGEDICACLRLKPGSKLTESELKQYCKGKIAHFKIPKHVYFFDGFPKTTSGKIQRFKLREKVMGILGIINDGTMALKRRG